MRLMLVAVARLSLHFAVAHRAAAPRRAPICPHLISPTATQPGGGPRRGPPMLYRKRWSVELFFKWIKQHLRIKKFWGTSENAVRIQIYCAIITYCLVAIVQHDMKLERSIYEVLQILGISLTDKATLRDLFDKSNFKNVNVPYGSSEPNLFNF